MIKFDIKPLSKDLATKLQHKIDFKTKPLGALGKLEEIAFKIGLIQNSLTPELLNPTIILFASDHGIATEGTSLYPQEVTYQMVLNFLNKGAAINIFCNQNNINIKVVDAGVKFDFDDHKDLINAKISKGTKNFLHEPAMSQEECKKAIETATNLVKYIYYQNKCNVIGFGEMGIANTSSASVIFSLLCNIPIEEAVGRGTGLDDEKLRHKKQILKKAIDNYKSDFEPLSILQYFGGFEIAMICGAMLQAAELGMTIIVDGFIVTSALIIAHKICPDILDYCIFSHQSNEHAHKKMLECLNVEPVMNLDLRLGEGTGVAITYPVIQAAVNFLNQMSSFDSAGVSNKVELLYV